MRFNRAISALGLLLSASIKVASPSSPAPVSAEQLGQATLAVRPFLSFRFREDSDSLEQRHRWQAPMHKALLLEPDTRRAVVAGGLITGGMALTGALPLWSQYSEPPVPGLDQNPVAGVRRYFEETLDGMIAQAAKSDPTDRRRTRAMLRVFKANLDTDRNKLPGVMPIAIIFKRGTKGGLLFDKAGVPQVELLVNPRAFAARLSTSLPNKRRFVEAYIQKELAGLDFVRRYPHWNESADLSEDLLKPALSLGPNGQPRIKTTMMSDPLFQELVRYNTALLGVQEGIGYPAMAAHLPFSDAELVFWASRVEREATPLVRAMHVADDLRSMVRLKRYLRPGDPDLLRKAALMHMHSIISIGGGLTHQVMSFNLAVLIETFVRTKHLSPAIAPFTEDGGFPPADAYAYLRNAAYFAVTPATLRQRFSQWKPAGLPTPVRRRSHPALAIAA